MFLRLIKLIIKQNKHIESIRELLFSHKYFNLAETFALFDINGNGKISPDELEEVFDKKFDIKFTEGDLERLVIDIVDGDNDGTIDLREFTEALTPHSPEFKHGGRGSVHHLSLEQRHVTQQASMETLAWLFDAIIFSDNELHEKREQLQLDGGHLFDSIDVYKMGYISTHSLATWITEKCGFIISSHELAGF